MDLREIVFTSSILIVVTLIVRALLVYKLPKWIFKTLWVVVLARLLVPVSMPSAFSVYNLLDGTAAGQSAASSTTTYGAAPVVAPAGQPSLMWVWVLGLAVLSAYFIIGYVRSVAKFRGAADADNTRIKTWLRQQPHGDRIRVMISGSVASPISYGIIRPKILLPKNFLTQKRANLHYVLRHEYTHIIQGDLLLKLLFTVCLCIYWFHPLVWVMYFMVNRDIELCCDERVLRTPAKTKLNKEDYAKLLLALADTQRRETPLFVGFGKHSMQERIVSIMKLQKKSIVTLVASIALIVGVTMVFGCTPVVRESAPQQGTQPQLAQAGSSDPTAQADMVGPQVDTTTVKRTTTNTAATTQQYGALPEAEAASRMAASQKRNAMTNTSWQPATSLAIDAQTADSSKDELPSVQEEQQGKPAQSGDSGQNPPEKPVVQPDDPITPDDPADPQDPEPTHPINPGDEDDPGGYIPVDDPEPETKHPNSSEDGEDPDESEKGDEDTGDGEAGDSGTEIEEDETVVGMTGDDLEMADGEEMYIGGMATPQETAVEVQAEASAPHMTESLEKLISQVLMALPF